MLTIEEKIKYFEKYLFDINHNNCMMDELHLYFFELQNGSFNFLNQLESYADIENKVKFIVSKMFMHDHEDGLSNIIENYLF